MNKHFKIFVQADHNCDIHILRDWNSHSYLPGRYSRQRLQRYLNTHYDLYSVYYTIMEHNIGVTFRFKE